MGIYFIRDQQHRVKIGVTIGKNASGRLASMQTGNADRLVIARFIAGAEPAVERWLHWHYRHLHIGGEWFRWCETMLTLAPPALANDRSRRRNDASNKADWIEAQIRSCVTVARARDRITAYVDFGRWCDENGFGKNVMNHQDRAAAIAMGREPEALRACLEATGRRSLQWIYRFEFSEFAEVRSRRRAALAA